MTLPAGSAKLPAPNVTKGVPKLTAPPIVIVPVLAPVSPMVTVPAPVTPPVNAVISADVKSKAEAGEPASDMAVEAVEGLSVKAPVVVNALLPLFPILTESAIIVMAPEPEEILSLLFCE